MGDDGWGGGDDADWGVDTEIVDDKDNENEQQKDEKGEENKEGFLVSARVKGDVKQFKVFELRLKRKQYRPGDTIDGMLLIHPKKALKVASIRTKLLGASQVKWREGEKVVEKSVTHFYKLSGLFGDGDAPDKPKSKLVEKLEKKGKGPTSPTRKKVFQSLTPELHSFPISLKLDQGIPSVFKGGFGEIRYVFNCYIDLDKGKDDPALQATLPIFVPVDVTGAKLTEPSENSDQMQIGSGCCSSGVVSSFCWLSSQAAAPGENLLMKCEIKNRTSRKIGPVQVKLRQIAIYRIDQLTKEDFRDFPPFPGYDLPPAGWEEKQKAREAQEEKKKQQSAMSKDFSSGEFELEPDQDAEKDKDKAGKKKKKEKVIPRKAPQLIGPSGARKYAALLTLPLDVAPSIVGDKNNKIGGMVEVNYEVHVELMFEKQPPILLCRFPITIGTTPRPAVVAFDDIEAEWLKENIPPAPASKKQQQQQQQENKQTTENEWVQEDKNGGNTTRPQSPSPAASQDDGWGPASKGAKSPSGKAVPSGGGGGDGGGNQPSSPAVAGASQDGDWSGGW